ncbi:MAG: D-tyrosyl-tRNA(Tyr) deacylase [Clostridia bacterium]|nr:D-tyrosyl-tRNA(Tyr) deacylase [Clostridia bacterium]
MRAVVQRVRKSQVSVAGEVVGKINGGLMVLLGVGRSDGEADARYLAEKIANLRIFTDSEGKMNLSVLELDLEVLAISQFTLYGDCRKGRRPGFSEAMDPMEADRLYNLFVGCLKKMGVRVSTGRFQAEMDVELVNNGPVTMMLDSNKLF